MSNQLACCFLFVSLMLFIGQATDADSLKVGQSLVTFLFGQHQWKFGQYCNDTRPIETIKREDDNIQWLYNGSYLTPARLESDLTPLESARVIAARTRQQLCIFCSIGNWGYANDLLESLSNAPHEDESECLLQLEQFSDFVDYYTRWNAVPDEAGELVSKFSLDHWHQYNSFGRFATGPAHKNDLLPGDYDGCTQLPSTRYCLGAYDKLNSTQGEYEHGGPIAISSALKIGLCLPRSCSSRLLRKSGPLMRTLNWLVKRNLLDTVLKAPDQYQLFDVYCPPLKNSPWYSLEHLISTDLGARLLAKYLPLVWLLLLTLATSWGWLAEGAAEGGGTQFQRSLLASFDLRANWRSFRQSAHINPKLAGLNGAKVVSMNWLMLSHILIACHPYLSDYGKIRSVSWHGAVILQGQHGVPIFFIISGMLAGLKYLKGRRTSYANMILWRYARLLPMYLVVYAYLKKFAHLTSEGPLWDHGVSVQSETRQCMTESWLVPLMMLANFVAPGAHCIVTGWHIANDFQVYLVLPILFWLYGKSRLAGRVTVAVVFVVSHGSHMWLLGTSETFNYYAASMEPMLFGHRSILDRASLDYVNPLGRLGTYFIGVLLADLLLVHYESQRVSVGEAKVVSLEHGQRHSLPEGELEDERDRHEQEDENEERCETNVEIIGLTAVGCSRKQKQKKQHPQQQQQQQPQGTRTTRDGQARVAPSSGSGRQATAQAAPSNGPAAKLTPVVEESLSPSGLGSAGLRACKYGISLTNFKDTVILLFGMQAAYLSLFTVIWPTEMKLIFEPYSKAFAYPWVRVNVELGWTICLYYLLRDNGLPASAGTGAKPGNGAGRGTGRGADAGAGFDNQERSVEMAAKAPSTENTSEETKRPLGSDDCADHHQAHNGHQQAHGHTLAKDQLKNSHSSGAGPSGPVASLVRNGRAAFGRSSKANLQFGGSLLKFRLWNVLVKLNYTLMLVHFTLIRQVVLSRGQLFVFTWSNYFQLATFLIVLAHLVSLVIHLTVEMPLTALVKFSLQRINKAS